MQDAAPSDDGSVSPTPPIRARVRKRRWPVVVAATVVGLLLMGGAVYAWNYVGLQRPMNAVLEEDPRNEGISVKVRHEHYVVPSTIVLDLQSVVGHSRADVFRVLLQYAEKMKSKSFDRVLLAWNGSVKFALPGEYFKQLGEEYGTENPVYTMRTFPSHVETPAGEPAYSEWSGGALGVLQKQMEDFGDVCDTWFAVSE